MKTEQLPLHVQKSITIDDGVEWFTRGGNSVWADYSSPAEVRFFLKTFLRASQYRFVREGYEFHQNSTRRSGR